MPEELYHDDQTLDRFVDILTGLGIGSDRSREVVNQLHNHRMYIREAAPPALEVGDEVCDPRGEHGVVYEIQDNGRVIVEYKMHVALARSVLTKVD